MTKYVKVKGREPFILFTVKNKGKKPCKPAQEIKVSKMVTVALRFD